MTHSSRGRLLAPVLAACSLLLAGCDAVEGAAAATGTTPAPVAVPAADPTASVDWKRTAYRALDCTTRDAWVADALPAEAWDAETVRTTFVDVTGDGADEALVQASCPAPTSTPADHVVVLGLAGRAPVLLGVLGEDLFFPQATVTPDGTTVTLSGPTVAGDDPTCCPGHLGTVTYGWDGARFVVRTRSEVPATSATALPDGEHVGVLRSVAPGEVRIDVVEWFEGTAARTACRADGEEIPEAAWCDQYYARDAGDAPVTVPVSADAALSYLDLMTMESVPVRDVALLAGTGWVSEDPDAAGYTRFRTEGGVLTSLESVYTP